MAQVFVEEMKFDREVYTREFNDAYYRAGNYVAHRIMVEMPALVVAALSFGVLVSVRGTQPVARGVQAFSSSPPSSTSPSPCSWGFTIAAGIRGEVGPAVFLPGVHHPQHARRRLLHPQGDHPRRVDLALLDLLHPVDVVRAHGQRVRGRRIFRPLRRGVRRRSLRRHAAEFAYDAAGTRAVAVRRERAEGSPCEPVLGDTVLASFVYSWTQGQVALAGIRACSSCPCLLTFYLGVRHVKHERR